MSHIPPPSTLPAGSIVDSYRRDSGGARQDRSTDQQLTEFQKFCATYQLVVRHNFVDQAKSGGSTAGRDDFNHMMAHYETPTNRPHGLLLWNYARFARDIDDAQFNKIRLRQWGMIVHSLNDQVPEGEYGRVIEFLIDVANEEKRKQTSVDAKRGLRELVEKYHCVPGIPPVGFTREPVNIGLRRDKTEHIAHKWVPIPEMITRIKKAFQMKTAGESLDRIHKATRLFSAKNSYRTFFQNKLYIGILIYADMTIENYCKPMIDRKTWDKVQEILALHADRQHTSSLQHHPRRKFATTYLLSGISFCARCGSPLWGMTSGQRDGSYYLRYACTRAKRNRTCDLQPVPARTVENAVINAVTNFFDHPANLQLLIELDREDAQSKASENGIVAKDLQEKLKSIRRSITNITNAIAERSHSKSLLKKLSDLEQEEIDLQTQLNTVKTATPTLSKPLTLQEIKAFSANISERLQNKKDINSVRSVITTVINEVLVDRNDHQAFGTITIHSPSEAEAPKKKDENPAIIITAFTTPAPVGAHLNRRSIHFSVPIKKPR